MFTGLIEATAAIEALEANHLKIERPNLFDDLRVGSSVSVSGVCLTVTELQSSSMTFDLHEETKNRTNLSRKKKGDRVNLERSMKAGDRFEGHIVQGHVEATGEVTGYELRVTGDGSNTSPETRNPKLATLGLTLPQGLVQFAVPKGSITIDGVSLTIASVEGSIVTIALIPHTLELTTLGSLKKGDLVNIETDLLVRAVLHSRTL